jgi:hypothetical protein
MITRITRDIYCTLLSCVLWHLLELGLLIFTRKVSASHKVCEWAQGAPCQQDSRSTDDAIYDDGNIVRVGASEQEWCLCKDTSEYT